MPRHFSTLRNLDRWLPLLCAVLISFGFWSQSAPARATVMIEIPLEQLAGESDAIVLGRVIGVGTRIVLVDGVAETHTVSRLRVNRWIKGSGSDVVLIDHIGGRFQDTMSWPTGTPTYAVGERVVVFLERAPDVPDSYRTSQLCQGKFAVNDGIEGESPTLVRRDTSGVSFIRWAEDGQHEFQEGGPEPAMPLSDFLSFVERHLRTTAPISGRTL